MFLEGMPQLKRILPPNDYKELKTLIDKVRREGVVFALPHNGELQDRQASPTIDGSILRPPYPVCILEFSASHTENVPLDRRSSYRIAVVIDAKTHINIISLAYADTRKMWEPPLAATVIYYDEPFVAKVVNNGLTAVVRTVPLLPTLYKEGIKRFGSEETVANILRRESVDELWAYIDFCRTLNDSEVTFNDVEPDPKVNFDRKLRGETPLYTYKTLTIGGPRQQGHGKGGGTHASPRSHMRRGHYRTLKSGKRVWINSMFVKGNGEGFVHKDYKVIAGATQ